MWFAGFVSFFIFLDFGNSGRCWLNWGITRVWCAPGPPRVADFMLFCFSGLCVNAVGMSSLRLSSPSQFGSKVQPTQRTPLLFVTVKEYGKQETSFLLLDEKGRQFFNNVQNLDNNVQNI